MIRKNEEEEFSFGDSRVRVARLDNTYFGFDFRGFDFVENYRIEILNPTGLSVQLFAERLSADLISHVYGRDSYKGVLSYLDGTAMSERSVCRFNVDGVFDIVDESVLKLPVLFATMRIAKMKNVVQVIVFIDSEISDSEIRA